MDGMTTLIIVFVVAIVAALLGLWAYRRTPTPKAPRSGKNEVSDEAEQWGVRISAPDDKRACPQVRQCLDKEYPIGERPQLPLPDCPFPRQCECRYIKLFERRKEERRSGQELRVKGHRFEKDNPPRRSGKDRRRKNVDWS
jgi:hypothetical protein